MKVQINRYVDQKVMISDSIKIKPLELIELRKSLSEIKRDYVKIELIKHYPQGVKVEFIR